MQAGIRASGSAALAHRCDVSQEDQVAALIDRSTREFGGWISYSTWPDPGWTMTRSATVAHRRHQPAGHHERDAAIHRDHEAARWFHRERGGGVGAGLRGGNPSAWCAAKAGILRFTAALRSLQAQKIRVNCIAPEVIDSPEDFAAAAVNLSLREDYAGRVFLYRASDNVEIVDYGDPGYRQAHPLEL